MTDVDFATLEDQLAASRRHVARLQRELAEMRVRVHESAELLTAAEHDAVAQAAELWGSLTAIVADGPARAGDLSELIFHVHAIQRAVLKQAAARAYPDLYRLLGGWPVEPKPEFVAEVRVCPTCTANAGGPPPPPEMPDPLPDPVVPDNSPRALLDECTRQLGCPARVHLSNCPKGAPIT